MVFIVAGEHAVCILTGTARGLKARRPASESRGCSRSYREA